MFSEIFTKLYNFKEFLVEEILPICQEYYLHVRYGKERAVDFRQRRFLPFLKGFPIEYNKVAKKDKETVFKDLKNGRKNLRILEVGIGTGSSFDHYPDGTKLIAVDPNKYVEPDLRKNLENYPGIKLEKFCVAFGENLHEIESESVDVVVTCLVACNVASVDALLKEISRVLVPGGKYYFMEHVLDHTYTRRYWRQKIMTLIGLWPAMVDGCTFKDLHKTFSTCKYFSSVKSTKFYLGPPPHLMFNIIAPHIYGTAIKG